MLVGGPDGWHPNAEMFYRAGGGPLLDIAPYYLTAIVSLLGPIESVAGIRRDADARAARSARARVQARRSRSTSRRTSSRSCAADAARSRRSP